MPIGKPEEMPQRKGLILLDRYRILDKIGQGGFGKVYRCKDTQNGWEFVAKVNSDAQDNDNEFIISQAMSGEKGFPKVYGSGLTKG